MKSILALESSILLQDTCWYIWSGYCFSTLGRFFFATPTQGDYEGHLQLSRVFFIITLPNTRSSPLKILGGPMVEDVADIVTLTNPCQQKNMFLKIRHLPFFWNNMAHAGKPSQKEIGFQPSLFRCELLVSISRRNNLYRMVYPRDCKKPFFLLPLIVQVGVQEIWEVGKAIL